MVNRSIGRRRNKSIKRRISKNASKGNRRIRRKNSKRLNKRTRLSKKRGGWFGWWRAGRSGHRYMYHPSTPPPKPADEMFAEFKKNCEEGKLHNIDKTVDMAGEAGSMTSPGGDDWFYCNWSGPRFIYDGNPPSYVTPAADGNRFTAATTSRTTPTTTHSHPVVKSTRLASSITRSYPGVKSNATAPAGKIPKSRISRLTTTQHLM